LEETTEPKKLSPIFINLFGVSDFGFGMMASVESLFFISFLYSIGLNAGQVALIGGLTSGFDIIWVFVAAAVIQRVNMRWGKYRSWFLVLPPVIFVFFVMNYWGFSGQGMGPAVIAGIGFLFSHLAWNITYAANMTMVQAYTNDPHERALLSSRKAMYVTLSGLAFSLIAVSALTAATAAYQTPLSWHYTIFAACMASIMIIGYLTLFMLSKPYEKDTRGLTVEQGGVEKISTGKAVVTALTNWQLWIVMITLLGVNFANMASRSVIIYLFAGVYGFPAGMSIYGTVVGIAGFCGAFLAPFLAKKVGKKNTYITGSLLYCTMLVITRFFLTGSLVTLFVGVTIAGMFLAFCTGVAFAIFADCVTFSKWRTGTAAAGFTMGMYSLPIKVAITVSRVLIPLVLGAAGHAVDPATGHLLNTSDAVLNAYKDIVLLYPGLIVGVMSLFLLAFFRLNEKRLAQMNEDIANGTAPFQLKGAAA